MRRTMAWIWFCMLVIAARLGAQPAEYGMHPDERIVGAWTAVGFGEGARVIFGRDHTWRDPEHPDHFGTWVYRDGKYCMTKKDGAFTAVLDERDQLVQRPVGEGVPDIKWVYRREGMPAPDTWPILRPEMARRMLIGGWQLVSIEKTWIPGAPAFDEIDFINDKRVKNTCTLAPASHDCEYDISGNMLMIKSPDPKLQIPVMNFRFEEDGRKLVLSPKQVGGGPDMFEMVYLRKEEIAPTTANELLGTWVQLSESGSTRQMQLHPDGRMVFSTIDRNGRVTPGREDKLAYRLWTSSFGPTMTKVSFRPNLGFQVDRLIYERKNDLLALTPLAWDPQDNVTTVALRMTAIWQLKKENNTVSDHDAITSSVALADSVAFEFDLVGDWSGRAGDGTEISYTFGSDGTLVWRVHDPQFARDFPEGIRGKYKLNTGAPIWELDLYDFDDPRSRNLQFIGIVQQIDERSFKLECRPSIEGPRPTKFSPEAVVFRVENR